MTRSPTWLGKAESARLEYKSARSMGRPESIVRAVVALRNREGGHVVVGVADDRALEGVTNSAPEAERLQQILQSRIEPRPEPGGVDVSVRSVSDRDVLEVRVRSGGDILSAERRQGLLGFWIREGPTTRGLTLSEVHQRLGRTEAAPAPRWPKLLEGHRGRPLLLGVVSPLDPAGIGPADLLKIANDLPGSYGELGLRPTGWIVLPPPDWPLPPAKPEGGKLRLGSPDDHRGVLIEQSGGLVGVAHSGSLCHYGMGLHPEKVIRPDALVEMFVSLVRVAGWVGQTAALEGRVRLELKLAGAAGWLIRPHVPGSIGWSMPVDLRKEARLGEDPEAVLVASSWAELVQGPDRLAFEALSRLWAWFGWSDVPIPSWQPHEARFDWPSAR